MEIPYWLGIVGAFALGWTVMDIIMHIRYLIFKDRK